VEEMPLLIIKDRKSRGVAAEVAPRKGEDPYAIRRLTAVIREFGYTKIIIKCDQEPAIKALRNCVTQELSGVEVLPEESPVGESQSNGEVESGTLSQRSV